MHRNSICKNTDVIRTDGQFLSTMPPAVKLKLSVTSARLLDLPAFLA